MDIVNIQSLIEEGQIIGLPINVDPATTFIQAGVFQNGNRGRGAANLNTYAPAVIPLSLLLGGGTNYFGDGTTIVLNPGNIFSFATMNISQFTNDSGYLTALTAWVPNGNSFVSEKYIGTNNNFALPIYTNGVERVRILATGEVGIGTTLPLDTLQIGLVGGTSTMNINGGNGVGSNLSIRSGTINGFILDIYNKNQSVQMLAVKQTSNTDSFINLQDGIMTVYNTAGVGKIGIGPHSTGDAGYIISRLNIKALGSDAFLYWTDTTAYFELNSAKNLGYTTPYLHLKTDDGGANTGEARISSFGDSYLTGGRLGIGTIIIDTGDYEYLKVYTDTDFAIKIVAENANPAGGYAEFKGVTDISDFRFGSGGSGTTPFGGLPGTVYLGSVSYSDLYIATTNVIRMIVSADGNIGMNGTPYLDTILTVIGIDGSNANYAIKLEDSSFNSLFTVSNGGRVNMASLPTSVVGLVAGDLWNNLGVVNIV